MQELISQIAALGIEITPTRSLMIIFGIILFTAVVVHLILHKVVLRAYIITHSWATVVNISAASLPFCSHSTAWTLTMIPCRVKASR